MRRNAIAVLAVSVIATIEVVVVTFIGGTGVYGPDETIRRMALAGASGIATGVAIIVVAFWRVPNP